MSIVRVSNKGQERRELRRQHRAALRKLIRDDRMANREEYWGLRSVFALAAVAGSPMLGLLLAVPLRIVLPNELDGLAMSVLWLPLGLSLATMTKCDRLIYLNRARERDEQRALASADQLMPLETSSLQG